MKKTKTILKVVVFLSSIFFLLIMASESQAECVYADEAYHVEDESGETITPIYRLYNAKSGSYLYSRGLQQANYVLEKWPPFEFSDNGPAFCAHLERRNGLTGIYRLYNTKTGIYLYVRGEAMREHVLSTFRNFEFTDGRPAFWASIVQQPGLTPIYRLYNTKTGAYLYARGEAMRDYVLNKFSNFEFTDGRPTFWVHLSRGEEGPLPVDIGSHITIGLWEFTRDELRDSSFRIEANRNYVIRDKNGSKIAVVPASTETRVKYDGDGNLRVYDESYTNEWLINKEVRFEAADGNNNTMIFKINRPEITRYDKTYNEYRGRIKLRYSEVSEEKRIWAINTLPLEHYLWGYGEITGTGDDDYDRTMLTAARTYAYWKMLYSTKYASWGFKVVPTPANQIYLGYDREKNYGDIRKAAEYTRGKIVRYKNGDVALSPYSSWTDGRTRSFEERWGSDNYPWCQSVSDPYGDYNNDYWDHSYKSTSTLVSEDNHMVGISAWGAVYLASEKGWDWDRILKYYLDDVSIRMVY